MICKSTPVSRLSTSLGSREKRFDPAGTIEEDYSLRLDGANRVVMAIDTQGLEAFGDRLTIGHHQGIRSHPFCQTPPPLCGITCAHDKGRRLPPSCRRESGVNSEGEGVNGRGRKRGLRIVSHRLTR